MSDQEELRFRRQAAEVELRLRRQAAERRLGEAQDWVPASVREAAPIALSNSNPDVVLRLLTDPRMERVWRTLRPRHDATKLKDLFLAAALLVDRSPQVIPAHEFEPYRAELLVLAQRIEELANDLRFRHIGGEMHRQALQELIVECRRRAEPPTARSLVGFLLVDRVRGDNQVRSYLAALVKFTSERFGTPHYNTVVAIARVALNKRDHEITFKMARGADRRHKAVSAARSDTPPAL